MAIFPRPARRIVMDPTTIFCSNRHCPARGQTGQGNTGIHSQKEQQCICPVDHRTFSATTGTVCCRLRTSAETVVIVVILLAHGASYTVVTAPDVSLMPPHGSPIP